LPADPEAMQRMLTQMQAEYRRALPEMLAEIASLWRDLAAASEPAARLEELRRHAHTIAGAAKTFGLPAEGDAARALEASIDALIASGGVNQGEELRRVEALIEALHQPAQAH